MQWGVFGLGTQRRVMVLVISDSVINQTLEHVTVLPVVEYGDAREIYRVSDGRQAMAAFSHGCGCITAGRGR